MNTVLRYLALLFILCSATFGAASVSFAADTIKIASIFSKTGPAAAANQHHIQAVRFAVEEINKAGGLLGKKVEIIEYDNQSSPIQSKLAAKKAVKAGVVAVVGASWSDHSLAMAPVLQRVKIPMISPDSTNKKVTLKGDYIFRACFLDPFQGQALAKFVFDEYKPETAVIIEDITSAYSQGLADAFQESFEALGGKVLARLEYKLEQDDFSEVIAKTKELIPDVLFIPGHDESGKIVHKAQQEGVSALMLGGDGWGYRAFLHLGGQELEEGYYTSHWHKDLDTPISKEFVERYHKIYDVNEFVAITFDAVNLLADAIKRAGATDGKAIRDALAATENFQGVTGVYSFDENGDPIKGAALIRVRLGRLEFYRTIEP